MRIVILWQGMSGYLLSWVTALANNDCRVLLVHTAKTDDAPFDLKVQTDNASFLSLENVSRKQLLDKIVHFNPDAVLISSWHIKKYRYVAKKINTPRILCMDNQWLGTPKQYLGVLLRRMAIKPYYDLVFLPGSRQKDFAKKLGFSDEKIKTGLYTCDLDEIVLNGAHARREFIFVGRLVSEKGIELLINSYMRYLDLSFDPYDLRICGVGPLVKLIPHHPKIIVDGFVQSSDLYQKYANSRIFVLPSSFEPWGVVLHEAAASGLVLIASSAVGSADTFIEPGKNGLIFRKDSAQDLIKALLDAEYLSETNFAESSAVSRELALKLSPSVWSSELIEWLKERMST